ncbi:MAG: FAD-binding oxidoreductase [Acidimicrobiia bacterium]
MLRNFWGWGDAGAALDTATLEGLGKLLAVRFPGWTPDLVRAPAESEVSLRSPRVRPPASLAHLVSDDALDRAGHAYGKALRDVVRALRRSWPAPPDLVVRPTSALEVAAVLDWCAGAGIACVPYGGGSSVVGGVETACGSDGGVVSLDLGRLDRILEVDAVSQAARIEAGILGPALEDGLRPHGLTLRHFPQSFEFSTLGGWIATRAGGHFATGPTHIDDFVESITMQTPAGEIETRRLPASGAGPSPDRLLLGSEGAFGVITSAWMRVLPRPTHRASGVVTFDSFEVGARACRAILQSGARPSNCRLLDPDEALLAGAGPGAHAVLLLAYESAHVPVDDMLAVAVEVACDHGGTATPGPATGRDKAADSWRSSFMRMPYMRDGLARLGAITETFETAITWDRFDEFVAGIRAAIHAVLEETCGAGTVTCRLTHVYPDGAAPYFTVVAPSTLADQLEQWDTVKAAASEAIVAGGATITHHHAVGRVHGDAYRRQVPALHLEALRAVKGRLDPAGVMNPGVLVP